MHHHCSNITHLKGVKNNILSQGQFMIDKLDLVDFSIHSTNADISVYSIIVIVNKEKKKPFQQESEHGDASHPILDTRSRCYTVNSLYLTSQLGLDYDDPSLRCFLLVNT